MDPDLLLHLCAPVTWRMALAANAVAPPSLLTEGFVHLSTPVQVTLPANAHYAGRTDLLALLIDPVRLPGELRFESPYRDAPSGMRFPHHYGPVPTRAVVSVIPFLPGSDGHFHEPVGLPSPDDYSMRVRLFDRALAQRRAAAVVPVRGGGAVLDPRFPASYEHNTLWMDEAANAATVTTEAARILGGAHLTHRRAVLEDPVTASVLASQGWHVQELRLMAWDHTTLASRSSTVIPVAHETVSRLWERSWRRNLPDADEKTVRQLVDREPLTDAVLRIVNLAVLDNHGEPIASAQLRIDGATATIEAVMTEPAHQRTGLARTLVLHAVAQAHTAGCDVIFLAAAADDWPRHWYARLGFTDVHTRYEATLPTTQHLKNESRLPL
ncbi:MAG: GNAT family N-acetyltransferase [Actinomycetota bacterium]|nr:GNAT family N-acetyltransferase [Actinomycetota bacterium]